MSFRIFAACAVLGLVLTGCSSSKPQEPAVDHAELERMEEAAARAEEAARRAEVAAEKSEVIFNKNMEK